MVSARVSRGRTPAGKALSCIYRGGETSHVRPAGGSGLWTLRDADTGGRSPEVTCGAADLLKAAKQQLDEEENVEESDF